MSDFTFRDPLTGIIRFNDANVIHIGYEPSSEDITITAQNDETGTSKTINVNMSGGGGAVLGQKTITENGTYDAEDDGLDGYDQVTVNVPESGITVDEIASGAKPSGEITISNAIIERAFQGRSNITKVNLSGQFYMGTYAFSGCSGITEVNAPNMTQFKRSQYNSSDYLFEGCSSLTSVNIPTSVTHIGDHAFFYCTNLRTLTIPSSVTKIDSYAFVGCDSLETVDIANSVKVIGDNAFLHDDYIKMVTIGSGVEEIGTWAFKGLDMVTSIVSKIEDVGNVKMGKDVFDEINMKACTLYVPRGTASSYKAAPQWRDFKKIVEQ